MNKFITRFRKRLLVLLIPTLIGIAYLGSTVLSSAPRKDKSTVKINNSTRSCEILSAEKHNGHIKVSLRNNSDQAITAYVLSSDLDANNTFTFKEEFAFSEGDAMILPSQSYEVVFGIPGRLNRRDEVVLNLSAIILEDNTGEGIQNIIRDIQDCRLGQKIQLMKALPVIDKLLRLSDTALVSYWDKAAKHDFEVAINTPDTDSLIQLNKKPLNNGEPDKESEQFKAGVQAGKEYVLRKHQEMKDFVELQGTVGMREDIMRLRDLYAKMIARF